MKKRSIAIALAAAALALGTVTANAEAMGRHHQSGAHHGMNHRDDMTVGWAEDLSLTAKQKLDLADARESWDKANLEGARETAWAIRDYRNDLSAGRSIDEQKVAELREKMVSLEIKRMELHRTAYGLLDDDQKKLLEKRRTEAPFHRNGDRGDRPGFHKGPGDSPNREEHWKAMEGFREEMHKAVSGNASDGELRALAEKKVDQRLAMIQKFSATRFDARKTEMPGRRR